MACIIRNSEGEVVGMTADNNRRSNLFDELNRRTPEIAQDAYAISQSMEFKDEVVKPQIMQHRARFQAPLTERGREIISRKVNVFITPATIRSFNDETGRLQRLTNRYNEIAKEISEGRLNNKKEFERIQNDILRSYQEEISEKVENIRGVEVKFNKPYLGSWEGNYEPSLNMALSIEKGADTGAISGLLFDIAESTSQDAFILEEASEVDNRVPLTEFTEDGFMHYPQIRVNFNKDLTVEEKSLIAQRLNNENINDFSIDGDYFIVSIIDFNSETYEQKEKHYAEMATAITTPFRREGEKVGTNKVRDVQEHIRKSKYVGARNEGNEQSQTREYDRRDLFEEVGGLPQGDNLYSIETEDLGIIQSENTSNISETNEVINQLQKTFPDAKVHQLNSEQIDNKLKELGVSEDVRKQVIAWHGTVKNIEDNRLSVDNSKYFGELLSGLYFGERRVSQSFAGITPFGDIQETSKIFKAKIDDSTFPEIDMRGESPTTDEALQNILSQKEYEDLLDKKRRGEIKGIRLINAVEHLYGESSSPTQYVVFDESVIENIKVYEGGLLRTIIDPLFQKGIEVTVNGFVHNGEVYLNTDNLNPETPIHEFAHIYNSWLKDNRPYTYQRGIELINEELTKENSEIKSVIDYVKETQPNLKGESLSEEILAQLIGERGVELINRNKKGGIVEWIKNVWDEIRNFLGLSSLSTEQVANLTIQDFAEMAATDLLKGERLTSEMESIKERAIADGTFMKAPNGNSTNLNERQWLQVRTEAFKNWFGDWINDPQNASKVVDENGEPLVVYRGDNEEFTEFDRSKTKGARYGKLFNLTSDKSFAYQHGNLRSFFVNSRNPLDIDNIGNVKIDKLIEGVNKSLEKPMDKSSEDNFRENPYELINIIIQSDKFITALSYAGYTGVQELSYNGVQAVIDPNQIKSATDNVGTFSENSNDIRFQITGTEVADSNYKLSTNVVEVNGFRTIQLLRGEELLGYIRTQPFEDGVEIKRSILTEGTQRGQGIGTKMYKLAIQDAIERGLPIYSDHSQTEAAKGVWNKLVEEGLAEFDTNTERFKVSPLPKSLDNNGEASAKDVYEYINRKNSEGVKVTPQDRINIIKSLVGFNSTDELLTMLKNAFMPEGYFNPTVKSLTENGYTQLEADNILRNTAIQEQINDTILKIESLPEAISIDSETIEDIDFVTLDTNVIGKMQNENPFKVKQELVEELGGIKDEQVYNDKINDEGLEIAKDMFEEMSQYNSIEVMEFNEDGEIINTPKNNTYELLNETMTEDENGIVTTSINNLLMYDDIVLETELDLTNILLRQIVEDAVDVGVDLIGLEEVSNTKPIEETKLFLFNLIQTLEGNISIQEFSESYNEFFNINTEDVRVEKHKNIAPNSVIIKDKTKTAYEMYVDHGLLYMGSNVYKPVNNRQDVEALYDSMATHSEMFPPQVFEGVNMNNESEVRGAIVKYVNEISKTIESENLERASEYVLNHIYFNSTLNHEIYIKSIPEVNNSEYLTTTFIADFYKEGLREKIKESEKYKDFYDNFEISKRGIEYKSTDPISMMIAEEYINENLKNYFAIKKDHNTEELSNFNEEDILTVRDVVMNFPQAISKLNKPYEVIDTNTIIVENTTEPFVRVEEGLYEMIDGDGNRTYYTRLPVNTSPYIQKMSAILTPISIEERSSVVEEPNLVINQEYNKKSAKENLECS